MKLNICILAGGEGKRMKSDLPKVCHLFKNKPMIVHIIEKSLELNADKIIIITGKHNLKIQETIQKYISTDIFEKLKFVIQETPLGTGHAVQCTLNEYNNNVNVLILNGDTPNLSIQLLNKFISSIGDNKLLISEIDNPTGYGRIIMDNKNQIIKIVEEKDCNDEERKTNKINSGIYLLNSNDLKKYLPLLKNNNKSKEYYLTDIIEIFRNNQIYTNGYLIEKYENDFILGVNTKEQLMNLEKM